MKEFKGISVSPGIAVGKAYLYLDDRPPIPSYPILPEEIATEMERFNVARTKASDEIQGLKRKSAAEGGSQDHRFLDAHLLMLSDPDFISQVENQLGQDLKNVEWIMHRVIETLVRQLEASNDTYLRERAVDIYDVANRVLNHLLYRERVSLADLNEEVILVTHNLLPSDTMVMNKRMVKAIAMDAGSRTSHTAIVARSFGLVAVLGLSDITRNIEAGAEIIVDGNAGVVIVEPDGETKERYLSSSREWREREVNLLTLNTMAAETHDGKLIELNANIEVPEETETVLAHGADGIGLYRSEFLFLRPGGPPSEATQYEAYDRVIQALRGKPVTIRTLDLGGDKIMPEMEHHEEKNPILGYRAIRFCLARKDIFRLQLRAILRASANGNVRIMFPMISGLEELLSALEFLEEIKAECRQEKIEFDEKLAVGSMIEIPSAAMITDILAKHVQFFSIGTNDLIQYTVAVDRGNEKIAYLYEPFHPGVLRLIKATIDNAHAAGIPVSMCGEMAGDPLATVVLLGLGLDSFSMGAFSIPQVKQIIRSVSMSEAEELVGTVMEMKSHN
ncbi:MAG TPA: phosphoenolpyruvate--protein phosphotransferase, partial [Spirochaetia bacterium]|nr:phosphoenolpyruvate--protein phosphotransferase [Spirochaetia bacterium]